VKGIEPSYSAWKAAALPLSYTRARPITYHAKRAASISMRVFIWRRLDLTGIFCFIDCQVRNGAIANFPEKTQRFQNAFL
jgi:hypothetical protein